jgi:hypothetical protein
MIMIMIIIIMIIIIIIKSTQGRVVAPLRDLVISLDLPVLQLRELINWQLIIQKWMILCDPIELWVEVNNKNANVIIFTNIPPQY